MKRRYSGTEHEALRLAAFEAAEAGAPEAPVLARAYAEHLGRLFVHAEDFGLKPSRLLLATVGLRRRDLQGHDDVLSVEAAERAADRTQVAVVAL